MIDAPPKSLGLVVLLVFLTFTAFYAESFVLTHFSHEHDHNGAGDGCALCSEIEQVMMLLEGFGRVIGAIFTAVIITYINKIILKSAVVYGTSPTPVMLKVRLNS
jgi:hypothetical protein